MKIIKYILVCLLISPVIKAIDFVTVEIINNSIDPVLVSSNHIKEGTPFVPLIYSKLAPAQYVLKAEGARNFFNFSTNRGLFSIARAKNREGKMAWLVAQNYIYNRPDKKDQYSLIADYSEEQLEGVLRDKKIVITVDQNNFPHVAKL